MIDTTVAVQYIGRKSEYTDRLYGTGLHFEQGQTRDLPGVLAKKFLRHGDMFAAGEGRNVKAPTKKAVEDDTREQLEKADKEKAQQQERENEVQYLKDQILATQDKDSIERFCKDNYKQDIDKRRSLDALREQAINFIDQYGAV